MKSEHTSWNDFVQVSVTNLRLKSYFEKVISRNSIHSLKPNLHESNSSVGYEQFVNGELAYGQVLLQLVEKYLTKYVNHKNITLSQFHQVFKVNLVVAATDLTDQSLVLLSRFSAPDLPVKYACRIGASIPFIFPPVLWNQKWGLYLGKTMAGNKLISGQIPGAIESALLYASPTFQTQFFGCKIKHDSVLSYQSSSREEKFFEFTDKFPEFIKIRSEEESWLPFLQEEYLQSIEKKTNFDPVTQLKGRQVSEFDRIPGFRLLMQIVETSLNIQGDMLGQLSTGGKYRINAKVGRGATRSAQEVRRDTEQFLSRNQ